VNLAITVYLDNTNIAD